MLLNEYSDILLHFVMQIPLYPATLFQGENDGEGMNVVLYFKVSETYSKDLPDHFRENISVREYTIVSHFTILPHVSKHIASAIMLGVNVNASLTIRLPVLFFSSTEIAQ